MRVVVALGGNALRGLSGDATPDPAARQLAALVLAGHEVVVTHGNGPQVGELLLDQDARGPGRPPPLGLDVLVAMTQAEIGYHLQRDIEDVLVGHGDRTDVVTIATEVVVDADDPSFAAPTKPVGPRLDSRPDDGQAYTRLPGGGWRRVVASPEPVHLVQHKALRAIVDAGIVPVCAGGGGIPVVREGHRLRGVEAVVDKDKTSALVARDVDADALVVLTDVAGVESDYGTPDARLLRRLTTGDARRMLPDLPAGSMRPKVEAAMRAALEGRRAVIAALDDALAAVDGDAGTVVVAGPAGGAVTAGAKERP